MVLDYKSEYDPDYPFTQQFQKKQVFQFHGMKLKAFRLYQKSIEGGLEDLLMHAEKYLDSTAERRGMEFFKTYYNENRDQTGSVEIVNERLSTNLSRRTLLRNLKTFKENVLGRAAEDWIGERYKEDFIQKIAGQGVPDFVLRCLVARDNKGVFLEESPFQYPQIWEVKCRNFSDKHSPQWWLENKMKYAPPFLARGIELILFLVFYTQGSLVLEKWIIVNPADKPHTGEGWVSAGELIERLAIAEE